MIKNITSLCFVLLCSFHFGIAQTKVITKKEAKKVAKTVNKSLNEMNKAIEKTDWSSLTNIISTTAILIEKHIDAITEIVQDIDTKQLEANAEKLAEKIEGSVDTEKLEQDMNNLSKTIERSLQTLSDSTQSK